MHIGTGPYRLEQATMTMGSTITRMRPGLRRGFGLGLGGDNKVLIVTEIRDCDPPIPQRDADGQPMATGARRPHAAPGAIWRQLILNVSAWDTTAPAESVTVMVTSKLPVAVGVPATCPVAALSVRPAGRVPVYDHVNDGVPPAATRLSLYAVPDLPLSSLPESVGAPFTTIVRLTLDVIAFESVTVIVALKLFAVVGVPPIVPLAALIDRPGGKPVALQVYPGVPPVAVIVVDEPAGYGLLTVHVGNEPTPVICGAGAVTVSV
jgi:hypothetical protein